MKTNQPKPAKQVFINCPFDAGYTDLFRTLVFTFSYLDHFPVFSETTSSTDYRLQRIVDLISHASLGVHDLSRHTAKNAGELSRFNLPLELGLDIGSKLFGGKKYDHKKIIVLDHSPHDYDQYIGDISGQDIIVHKNGPRILMEEIRNWLSRINPTKIIPGTDSIWREYVEFKNWIQKALKYSWSTEDIENMQMSEYRKFALEWIKKKRKQKRIQ